MKYLYVCDKDNQTIDENASARNILCTRLGLWRSPKIANEKICLKALLVRKIFVLMTKGRMLVFSANSPEEELMHTSCVVPRCWKFPYLNNNEYCIGPCNTLPKFRGQGVYPSILRHIVKTVGNESTKFYMVVDSNNQPSIRGIEKAGFKKIGTVEIRGIFKRYYKEGVSVANE